MEYTEDVLKEWIASVGEPDGDAMDAARRRQAELAKPPGSLGRLEELSVQLAGITGRVKNTLAEKALLVFSADNGVTEEGVSSAPRSVTAAQTVNLVRGRTGAAVIAGEFGCRLRVCDVGVDARIREPGVIGRKIAPGTGNIAKEPAMTRAEAVRAILTGAELAEETVKEGADVLGVGEMGIGNTTTSAAIASVLLGLPPEKVTGRGAGLDSEGLRRKIAVIRRAIAVNHPDKKRPVELLAKLGGYDIAGMVGLYLGGALYKVPVVIDGFISAVAAALACEICPAVRDYMLCSHVSKEPAGQWMLDYLEQRPLITAALCLGEGTGGVLLLPLLDAALAVYHSSHTFDNLPMERYVEWQ